MNILKEFVIIGANLTSALLEATVLLINYKKIRATILIGCLFTLFLIAPVYALDNKDVKGVVLLLPLNSVKRPYAAVHFDASNKYKPVQPANSIQMLLGNEHLVEFIPVNETIENWSEMVTFLMMLGKKVPAEYLADRIAAMFMQNSMNQAKILHVQRINLPGYTCKEYVIAYRSISNRRELIYISVLSGPNDCVMYEYATVVKVNENDEYKKVLETGRDIIEVLNKKL